MRFKRPEVKTIEVDGRSYRCIVCRRKIDSGKLVLVDEFPVCHSCLSEVEKNPLGVLVAVIKHYELEIEELEFEESTNTFSLDKTRSFCYINTLET